MSPWLEVIGWVGSILVVLSLMQARVLRFRWMNLAGSVIAAGYNAWVGIWPFAAMNATIAIIDVYWLIRLYREAHDEAVYDVVEVASSDAYFQRVVTVHSRDIARFRPTFSAAAAASDDRSAFLVVRGDETVGAVVIRDDGGGTAVVELDWVTPRFRDFTPGEFVHRRSGIFTGKGFHEVVVESPLASEHSYLARVGFAADGERWVRAV